MVSTGLENAILNGLVTGSFIALGAIGLSLVYNIADVPNFAHGELLMIGAYFALLVNTPNQVPVMNRFSTVENQVTLGGMALLFVLTVGAALGTVYLLGGLPALKGSWWPTDVSPPVAVGTHVAVASVLGAFVAMDAPSIWAAFVLSGLLLAFVAPFFDQFVFSKFREEDASLATMLMATMGLAFVLRFSFQALFGGSVRSYQIQRSVTIGGTSIDVSRAKFLDYYLATDGLTIELIDTAPSPNETMMLLTHSWITFALVVLGTLLAGYGVYRARARRLGEHDASYTFGPTSVGTIAGFGAFLLLLAGLSVYGNASNPGDVFYSSRIRASLIRLSVIGIAVVLMVGLHLLLQETKLGTAMRASSDNLDLAKVTGINTQRVMMSTWIIAGGYAAIGGIMIGVLFHQIVPSMGFFRLLPIFAAVILGGLASVYGAIVGAFTVGLAMEVGFYGLNIFGTVSGTHRVSLAFLLLLIVLLVRPQGIIGER